MSDFSFKVNGASFTFPSGSFRRLCWELTDIHTPIAKPSAQDVAETLNRDYPQGLLYRQSLADVLAERQRLSDEESHTIDRHDSYKNGQLARAAACYALAAAQRDTSGLWPGDPESFEPIYCRRKNLIRAGALILAEIERLDRMDPAEQEPQS